MKKIVVLLVSIIYFQQSNCMELSNPAINKAIILPEIVRTIMFHYFDTTHTYFQPDTSAKKITRAAYIQNVCCVNQLFYGCINQPEVINKLVKLILPRYHYPPETMHGIILYREKSTELRDFIDKITKLNFEKKSEPTPAMVFTIKKSIEERIHKGTDIDGRLFPFQKKGATLMPSNETCLYLAVGRNCHEYTKILLELGADPDFTKSEYTPLQKAVHNKNIPMMQLLFDFGARNRCLVEAVKLKYVPAIELIIGREDLSEAELDQAIAVASQASDNIPIITLLKTVKRKENPKTFIRRNRRIFSSSDSI
jgi:hypothetical protein